MPNMIIASTDTLRMDGVMQPPKINSPPAELYADEQIPSYDCAVPITPLMPTVK